MLVCRLFGQDKDEVLIPLCVDTIPTPKARGWVGYIRVQIDVNALTTVVYAIVQRASDSP